MASKKQKLTVRNSQQPFLSSPASSVPLGSSQSSDLVYCAKFLHGSPDSRDKDCVYVIDSSLPFPSHVSLVEFCKSDVEDRNVIQLGQENPGSEDWYVKKSHRGPPDEVNNALLETHRNDPDGAPYEFLIHRKVCRSVILRYVIASKAIIVKMRRIDACRPNCLTTLASWDFASYLRTVHTSCAPQFEDLTRESAKYVAFHLGQSYLLSLGLESYTKRDLVNYLPELDPIIYYSGDTNELVPKACVEAMKTLEALWHAQGARIFASPLLDKRFRLQSFHLKTQEGQRIARNYLEADCGGTVIDMMAERIVALGPLLPLHLSDSDDATSSTGPVHRIQSSPSWRSDIKTTKANGIEVLPTECRRFIFGNLEGKWHVFHDLSRSNDSSPVNFNSKTKPKASSSKSKQSSMDEATQATLKLVLERLAHSTPDSLFSLSVDISQGKIIGETARSNLTLLETKLQLPPI